MAASSKTITTSYLVGNLHCPSCVAVIKNALEEEYSGRLFWVSPNVVTSVVTVEHQDAGAGFVRDMGKTLEDSGFEVCAVESTADLPDELCSSAAADIDRVKVGQDSGRRSSGGAFELWWRLWRASTPHESKAEIHFDKCDACKSTAATLGPEDGLGSEHQPHLNTISASSLQKRLNGVALPRDANKSQAALEEVVIDGIDAIIPLWQATISVGGMTCASCANTITEEMGKHPWVSRIVVNLVANRATVDIKDPARAEEAVKAIEDLGYDAALDELVNLQEQTNDRTQGRELEIKVDGIFCSKCPDRILKTLRNLKPSQIKVLKPLSREFPLLKISYVPQAPTFTIRHILRAIEATDPSLEASIHHPLTLEQRSKAISAKHQRELSRRLLLTLTLAIPTFIFGIVYMSLVTDSDRTRQYLMQPWRSGLSRLEIILFALSTPVYFFAADIFHVRAIKEVRYMWRRGSRTPLIQRFYKFGSMNMLMSLGTTIAYFSSVGQMMASGIRHDSDVPASRFYFDSVVFLTFFLLAGRLIEAYSKSKTGDAVGALAKLRPSTALLVEQDPSKGQVTTSIPIDQLEHGDTVRVPHGASPGADGVILIGDTSFDESSLTGESRPIKKTPGDHVFAGTVNKGHAITIHVTGTSGKSMLDQIVEAVREGQTKRAPVEQIADLLTSYFVPVITLVAVITWVIWLSLAQAHVVSDEELKASGGAAAFAFQFAIAVFVVACPCGLALAAPTAIFVGGGIAAKHGILAKGGGEAFEKASRIDCVVFDKTGTLTEGGEPKITDVELFPDNGHVTGVDRQTLLSALKAVEEQSSHPIAKAIVSFCGGEVPSAELGKIEELPGRGMKASHRNKPFQIAVGNEVLMRHLSVTLSVDVLSRLQRWKGEAKSVAVVAFRCCDGGGDGSNSWTLGAVLSISDPVRREARAVVRALDARGTQVWMLSGDNATTAKAVARLVGIRESRVLAEVLPSEKASKVGYLQATLDPQTHGSVSRRRGPRGRRRAVVAMVGDGINDSPALTRADVGIAIGSGSDVAVSSADFVLASSSLASVLTLLHLSRAVLGRIKLNFAWAVVYNLLAVPIAAGCLYAIKTEGGGARVRLDPVWAALAMALSSISVVLSSLCLRARLPWVGFRHRPVMADG
ncbi:uncharacterized protein UV8b_00488 [Ustilaginoidea virens]|uniref:HMA domain-containing protein n=1 Tax=Ustilaginoidea virens TaxID=1159556 RepID=A0A8E5ME53_USTVR|nr:uncharacterized protein UV8b_00488 [Ustilaginoidea virens]QUC16247.1 hypothetical protein UV8b_00488 [Ustilaginoidea virens]